MTPINYDIDAIRKLYASSSAAKAALDYFAGRQNNANASKVDRLLDVLRYRGHDVSRFDIIEFFRALEAAKCGRFVIGRKGHPTRFEWSASLISVGQAAAGETNVVDELTDTEALSDDDDTGLLEHRFRLRADLELTIELPDDLTASEAGRLADFIKTLPFGV
ncbi:MAG: hypothetical protein ACYC6J_09920 [Coriobacteriia bacterium]